MSSDGFVAATTHVIFYWRARTIALSNGFIVRTPAHVARSTLPRRDRNQHDAWRPQVPPLGLCRGPGSAWAPPCLSCAPSAPAMLRSVFPAAAGAYVVARPASHRLLPATPHAGWASPQVAIVIGRGDQTISSLRTCFPCKQIAKPSAGHSLGCVFGPAPSVFNLQQYVEASRERRNAL